MTATLALDPKLDLRAAGPLRDEILDRSGADLVLDANAVNHVGALALQVIRAAAKSWEADGHVLSLTNVSTDVADQLALLGFTPETVTRWEQPQ